MEESQIVSESRWRKFVQLCANQVDTLGGLSRTLVWFALPLILVLAVFFCVEPQSDAGFSKTAAVVICLAFVIGSFIWSAGNIAFTSGDIGSLQDKAATGNRGAKLILNWRKGKRERILLPTILIANLGNNNAFMAFLVLVMSPSIAAAFSTILVVFYGELLAQTIASKRPFAIARLCYWPMVVTGWLLFPLSWLLGSLFGWLLKADNNEHTPELELHLRLLRQGQCPTSETSSCEADQARRAFHWDDEEVFREANRVNPLSILEVDLDEHGKPRLPNDARKDREFRLRVARSQAKWCLLQHGTNQCSWVLDARKLAHRLELASLTGDDAPVDPREFMVKPFVVTDAEATMEDAWQKYQRSRAGNGPPRRFIVLYYGNDGWRIWEEQDFADYYLVDPPPEVPLTENLPGISKDVLS